MSKFLAFVTPFIIIILGKCKALWGKPRTLLRLSQRSTELSCTRFDEERSKKIKNERRCGTFFLREHISPRTSSTVVPVQVVGVCEVHTLAGKLNRTRCRVGPDLRLPMRKKENVEERFKQLYSRSQIAPTNSVKDKSNSVVCKKKLFVAELSISCGRSLHDSELQW